MFSDFLAEKTSRADDDDDDDDDAIFGMCVLVLCHAVTITCVHVHVITRPIQTAAGRQERTNLKL